MIEIIKAFEKLGWSQFVVYHSFLLQNRYLLSRIVIHMICYFENHVACHTVYCYHPEAS